MVISLRPGMAKEPGRAAPTSWWSCSMSATTSTSSATSSGCGATWWRFSPPSRSDTAIRVEFFGDEIDRISEINPLTGEVKNVVSATWRSIPPPTTSCRREKMQRRSWRIQDGDGGAGRVLSRARTSCSRPSGSSSAPSTISRCCRRSASARASRTTPGCCPGERPAALPTPCSTTFPKDFLLFVDESHVTLPQVRGMYGGDRARKQSAGGLRVPAAVGALTTGR